MITGKLTDVVISQLRARDKIYKASDGDGMSLIVHPNGKKWWRFDFKYHKKRNSISLGVYPDITLSLAREKRAACLKALLAGVHPTIGRDNILSNFGENQSFRELAESWFRCWKKNKTEAHVLKIRNRLSDDILPWIGNNIAQNIDENKLLDVIKDIEISNSVDKAHRVRQTLNQIFKYGVGLGILDSDPSRYLRHKQLSLINAPYPRITSSDHLKQIMMGIISYKGHRNCKLALQFAPLVFVKPTVLINGKWGEIKWNERLWLIPDNLNTTQSLHAVPLCDRAIEILAKLNPQRLKKGYIFHSHSGANRPLSANTLNHALAKIASKKEERITVTSFRNVVKIYLKEMGWSDQTIGAQLGTSFGGYTHQRQNWKLNLNERRSMMAVWANYLESLTSTADQISMYAAVRPKTQLQKDPTR
jgi:integrase